MPRQTHKKIKIFLLVASVGLFVYLVFSLREKFLEEAPLPEEQIVVGPGTYYVDATEDFRGLGYSGQRKVAVDSNGSIFAAYRKKWEGNYEIFVSKITATSRGKTNISGNEMPISAVRQGTDQRVPSIAVDGNGVIHVVWYGSDNQQEENNRQVKYSKSSDGGKTWSTWKNISYVEGYSSGEELWQEHPVIAFGSDGNLYAVWEGKDSEHDRQQIKFSKSLDGGETWSNWKNVGPTPGNTQSRPVILVDSSGRLHLLMYSSMGDANQHVHHAFSDNQGENWSNWQQISAPGRDSRHISAAVGAEGRIHSSWRDINENGLAEISYSVLDDGRWTQPEKVAESSDNQFFPSLSIDENNQPLAIWMETSEASELPRENPESGRIKYAVRTEDGFSQPQIVGTGDVNLYPNFSEQQFETNTIPIVYLSANEGGKFAVVVEVIEL